jgi:threonyl-tRNA synthetase
MGYCSIFRNKLKAAGITLSVEDVLKELRDLRTALSIWPRAAIILTEQEEEKTITILRQSGRRSMGSTYATH